MNVLRVGMEQVSTFNLKKIMLDRLQTTNTLKISDQNLMLYADVDYVMVPP